MENNKKDLSGVVTNLHRDGLEKDVKHQAASLGMGYSDLRNSNISDDILSFLSREEAIKFKSIPLRSFSKKLYLGIVDPDKNFDELFELLKKQYNYKHIIKVLVSEQSYLEWLPKFNKIQKAAPFKQEEDHIDLSNVEVVAFDQLNKQLQTVPIQDLLKLILLVGFNSNSSDIHIEPSENNARIRFRVDGVLHEVAEITKEHYNYLLSQIELNSDLKLNVDYPQEGRFSIVFNNMNLSVRIETMPSMHGDDVALRLFNTQSALLKIHDLGLSDHVKPKLERALSRPNGMILVVGPTGAGKTSTIYAILNELNSEEVKIVTLEDPVEYELPGVTQSQINEGDSFADRLKAVLREDPNIIMVGEIRDANTAQTALQAALTGHLLISTLHANNAVTAITRLVDMINDPIIVTASTNIIISQRLVRIICPSCKEEYRPSQYEKQEIDTILSGTHEEIRPKEPFHFYRGKGCTSCHGLGYNGRIGIFEILILSDQLEKMINSNSSILELERTAVSEGMITMEQDGLMKAIEGITTISEVLRIIKE